MDLQPSTPTKQRVWNYKKNYFNKFNSLITNVDLTFIPHRSLDEACELFTNKFIELAKHVFLITLLSFVQTINLGTRPKKGLHLDSEIDFTIRPNLLQILLIGIITKRLKTKLTT